jgi:hypothetical protein
MARAIPGHIGPSAHVCTMHGEHLDEACENHRLYELMSSTTGTGQTGMAEAVEAHMSQCLITIYCNLAMIDHFWRSTATSRFRLVMRLHGDQKSKSSVSVEANEIDSSWFLPWSPSLSHVSSLY